MAQSRKERLPFTLWQLQVFCDVVERGGYSAAARELQISQPAASGLVTQLERIIGLPLMERDGRQVRLTADGRLFYEQAQRITAQAAALQALIEQVGQSERGRLSVGTGATIAVEHLAEIVTGFRREYPGVEVSLAVENRPRLVEGLLEGRHDLIVTAGGPLEGTARSLFARDELLLLASPQNELAQEHALPLAALSMLPLFLRERGSHGRHVFEEILAQENAHIETIIEIADNEAIKRVVNNDLGVAALARSSVARELERGTLVQLDVLGLPAPFDFYVFWQEKGRRILDTFLGYLLARAPAQRESSTLAE